MKDDLPPGPGQNQPLSDPQAPESQAATVEGAPPPQEPGVPLRKISTLLPGQTFGPYRIERLLGMGGMGEVYEAEQIESGRRVALKVLSLVLTAPTDRARFVREGRLAASISHPNSVYIYGTEEINGIPVISMELVAGGTLKDRITEKGPFSPSEAVDAILHVIGGLEAAAAVGVLHRDIKPSNCFLDRDGTVKVGDFGLSMSTVSRAETHLTATGTFLGTPAFASPEQVRCEDLDVRSDIYSVGATLYYLLTGKAPFEDARMGKLLADVLERPPEPPRSLRREIPKGLERVILRCLEKDPVARFQVYSALKRELAPYSSAAPRPATLGLRFVAGAIDGLLFALGAMTFTVLRAKGFDALEGRQLSLLSRLLSDAAELLYFTIAEGLWGASLGKAVCGLRVVGPARNVPGLSRAFRRAFIWLMVPSLPMLIYTASQPNYTASNKDTTVLLLFAVSLALMVLLFSTARRKNGFAAVHDLASGTRVILKSPQAARPLVYARKESGLPGVSAVRLGPYSIVATLTEGATEKLLAAYDDRLRRGVWIHVLPAGSPAVSAVRRDLGRPGRLRWLNGGRTSDESWDAYEAPVGGAFTMISRQQHPWASVRYWLLDLAEELSAGLRDGSIPPSLSADRVWITPEGRAKLLDFAAPAEEGEADRLSGTPTFRPESVSAQAFLHEIARAGLKGPLPVHAHVFLEDLRRGAFPNLEVLVERLRCLIPLSPSMSRPRRIAQLSLFAALPLFVTAVVTVSSLMELKWSSEHRRLYSFFITLNRLRSCQIVRERRLLQLSAASEYRRFRADPAFWSQIWVSGTTRESLRRAAEEAAARYPVFSAEELADAQTELKPLLESTRRDRVRARWAMPLLFAAVFFLVMSLFGLVSAFVVRGGVQFHFADTAIVRRDGSEASRLRTFWRALVAWSPWLLLPLGMLLANNGTLRRPLSETRLSPVLGAMLLFLAGAVWAALHPQRGLQDRVAGTCLVPR